MNSSQDLAVAESRRLAEWERLLEQLIRKKGGTATPAEFHEIVNVVYHDVEASNYDVVHQEMWDSLLPVMSKLVDDAQRAGCQFSNATLADVGCGTGLATELFLRSPMGTQVSTLAMVDTSSEMLNHCRARSSSWQLPVEFVNGQIEALPTASADILLTSSVLHHIRDLLDFCGHITRVLKPGGLYFHMQDTRCRPLEIPVAAQRAAQLTSVRRRLRAEKLSLPRRIADSLMRRVRRLQGDEMGDEFQYIDEVNRRLIAAGHIKKPMTAREIWSVTDLRLGDLPYAAIDGVDIAELALALDSFDKISVRTYGFFGIMPSQLPAELLVEDRKLFAAGDEDGAFLAGCWRRRN